MQGKLKFNEIYAIILLYNRLLTQIKDESLKFRGLYVEDNEECQKNTLLYDESNLKPVKLENFHYLHIKKADELKNNLKLANSINVLKNFHKDFVDKKIKLEDVSKEKWESLKEHCEFKLRRYLSEEEKYFYLKIFPDIFENEFEKSNTLFTFPK